MRVSQEAPYPEASDTSSRAFFVYVLASRSRVPYTGVTRDLIRRMYDHRAGVVPGFTRRYRVSHLVYFEETTSARSGFARERQIKQWSRQKKIALIESTNAGWLYLAEDWFPRDNRQGGKIPRLRSG